MAPAELSVNAPYQLHRTQSNERRQSPSSESASKSEPVRNQAKPEHIMTKLLEEKDREWHSLTCREEPLRLFDLPVDVLNLVINEVTHTNDLVALALTHSVLHRLAIPQIYSRFDIVWPDSSFQPEPKSGVDALTYGLATLVMAEDVFGEAASQHPHVCTSCGHCDRPITTPTPAVGPPDTSAQKIRRRRGNHYARFTKKFSLGNGPEDWIKEYLANTESGKMLGTLVALAVARMRSLQTFIWDMPTGILQDVWHALASLAERRDGQPCMLEKIWIRWHNNSPLIDGRTYTAKAPPHAPHEFWQSNSEYRRTLGAVPKCLAIDNRNRVGRPNFSMLPPLKSLNVLDIDECAYLDEMSILISESRHCLRELRVGLAPHAVSSEWAHGHHTDQDASQVAEGKSRFVGNISATEKRLGGVLGVLTGYVFDLKRANAAAENFSTWGVQATEASHRDIDKAGAPGPAMQTTTENAATPSSPGTQATPTSPTTPTTTLTVRNGRPRFVEDLPPAPTAEQQIEGDKIVVNIVDPLDGVDLSQDSKLRLEVLALERISLSMPILAHAFDWTTMRDITLLDCELTASFWTSLRTKYTPRSPSPISPLKPSDFPLRIRKLHTNTVTPTLLAFIRETLAPNTLEVLFLQQSEYHLSRCKVEKIQAVVKHHRSSLRKLFVDSSERDESDNGSARAEGYERWQFDRGMLNFITSGRMPKLRELGCAISVKDWHYLLQRLPLVTQLRALYLTYIAKSATTFVPSEDARDYAHQVLDILTIKPEIELAYLGVGAKCFEIVESRVKAGDLCLEDEGVVERERHSLAGHGTPGGLYGNGDETEAEEDGDEEDDGDGSGDDEEEDEEDERPESGESSLVSDGTESDGDHDEDMRVKMELREILFYDDKVDVFKARHGRL